MNRIKRFLAGQEGITGLETAIILIAFVIVASVFAFVVLSTGLFSAERGKETVFAGLNKAQANLELHGSVVLTDLNDWNDPGTGCVEQAGSDGEPDRVVFSLALAAGGAPVNVDPAATINTVAINYVDQDVRVADVSYTVTVVQGDSDNLLEPGELFEVTVNLAGDDDISTGCPVNTGSLDLGTNEHFTIEVVAPQGGTMLIARTMPSAIDAVMNLH